MKILKFTAPWCNQCKIYGEVVKNLCNKYNIELQEIDCDENPTIAEEYNIRSVPTLIVLSDEGKASIKISGVRTESELTNTLNLK